MTSQDALSALLGLIEAGGDRPVVLAHGVLRDWPPLAIAAFKSAGLLQAAAPAGSTVCPGCERNCAMPVNFLPAEDARPARALVLCDKPQNMGRIPLDFVELEQWQCSRAALAAALTGLLSLPAGLKKDGSWILGLLPGREHLGELTMFFEGGCYVKLGPVELGLQQLLHIKGDALMVAKRGFNTLTSDGARTPKVGKGSAEWRRHIAKKAADALHNKPGGTRDKHQKIRAIWASGKYSSRQLCAEEECAGLGMSFDTARKALKGTPDPRRGS